jgi:hypothetical protein
MYEIFHLLRLCHVTLDGIGLNACLPQMASNIPGFISALVIDNGHMTSGLSERMAYSLAQPPIPSGDNGHSASQIHGSSPRVSKSWKTRFDTVDDKGKRLMRQEG